VYEAGGVVYGCSNARSYRLGYYGRGRPGGVSVVLVRVASRVVAYSTRAQGVDTASESVSVRRLTDGKRLYEDRATVGPVGPESFQSVASLVVKSDGSVAWIGAASSIGGPHRIVEVLRHDRRGLRLLDSGAAVARKSLRLRHSTLRWKHGGGTRRATLR
jgi:hypothetical protein